MGQELRNGLAGWFWFQVSHEAAAKIGFRARAASSEGLTVAGGATSKMAHSHASVPCCVGLSVGLLECLHSMAAARVSDPTESKEEAAVFFMA